MVGEMVGTLSVVRESHRNVTVCSEACSSFETSRTPLIAPTSPPFNRREFEAVNWSHPSYANWHIYARNDHEIISASFAAD